jgi:hypothetical protein
MPRIARVAIGPKHSFVAVRLPKGTQSAAALAHGKYGAALDRMDQRISTDKGCAIFFVRGKGGAVKAVQRCDNRKLRGSNKSQCRNAKKKFVKCGGGRRRARRR